MTGARNRYGPPEYASLAYAQIEHELAIGVDNQANQLIPAARPRRPQPAAIDEPRSVWALGDRCCEDWIIGERDRSACEGRENGSKENEIEARHG